MDITTFIITNRNIALLIGDYNTYRSQLSRQLLATRKRLGRVTKKNEKYSSKDSVTADDVGKNHEYVHLLLLTAERAWAHAMHMKSSHSEDNAGITGSTRSHIISRLHKAAKSAQALTEVLKDQTTSKASDTDLLEARAYQAALEGATEFEKQSEGQRSGDSQASEKRWQKCLGSYAEARVVYAALYETQKKEVFREILADTVDPTIRYAAYQAHLSRSIAIPSVAKRYFPKGDAELKALIEKLDPDALTDKPAAKTEQQKEAGVQEVPISVTWRGRKANIVDASIGQALAGVSAAEARLSSFLADHPHASLREKAAAYDDILISSQDAADATRRAIEELEKERADEGDPRMQDLRVTSLAVNYALVSWRVGRNRVLIGSDDGMAFSPQAPKTLKRPRKDGNTQPEQEESRGRKLARLRERLVLYDATIQSIDSVKELRGAMRDAGFVAELDGKRAYFQALKCVNIAYSHNLLGHHLNALALLTRAQILADQAPASPNSISSSPAPTLDLSTEALQALQKHTAALAARTHALVEIHKLEANAATAAQKNMTSATPLVQRLNDYPTPGTQLDLTKLVSYPPKVEAVPVKPLFLDVAFNYIEYPGRAQRASVVEEKPAVNGVQEQGQEKRKGWFGFGR